LLGKQDRSVGYVMRLFGD
jgi:hypothetical protein